MGRISTLCLKRCPEITGFASIQQLQESIPLFAAYNRLSKRSSSKTVETVRSCHFAASLARAALLVALAFPRRRRGLARVAPVHARSAEGTIVRSAPSVEVIKQSCPSRFSALIVATTEG